MHTSLVVASEEAIDITFAIPYSDCELLAGYTNGNIKLLRINRQEPHACTIIKTLLGHTQPITYLLLLRSGELISAACKVAFINHTNVYHGDIRVWDIPSCSCKHILTSSEPHRVVGDVTSIVALNNGLIAVASNKTLTRRAFDVWDIKDGKCLFLEQQPVYSPYKLGLDVIAGEYLVIYAHCEHNIYVWKVTHHECSFICSYPGTGIIYSMTVLPTEHIATGGFALCIYNLHNREISKVHEVSVNNVIEHILPMSYYRLLTVERCISFAKLRLWDYLTATSAYLGLLYSDGNLLVIQNIILDIRQHEFRCWMFPELLRPNKKYLEIIKNARLLSQAYRTGTGFFAALPQDLNISIAALTSPEISEAIAERIATEHFCKPEARQYSSFPNIF